MFEIVWICLRWKSLLNYFDLAPNTMYLFHMD